MHKHTQNTVTKEWLTIGEVMERLKVSRTTVYELTQGKKLTAYKARGIVRYKAEEVEKVFTPVTPETLEGESTAA